MPGLFSHHGFAKNLAAKLHIPEMLEHPHFSAWGAVGPDFLFFHPEEWADAAKVRDLSQFVNIGNEAYRSLKEVTELFSYTLNAYHDIKNWITGGLSGDVDKVSQSMMITLKALLARTVVSEIDFFDQLEPPHHVNPTEANIPNWYWLDIAHHHRTGDFVGHLFNQAGGDSQLQSYALGWLTHVSADLVGHPYVNLLCGGPYRNHWRRHVLTELCFDTYLWQHWFGKSLSGSRAHLDFSFGSVWGSPTVPGKLVDLLTRTLDQTYGNMGLKYRVPRGGDIELMFDLFFSTAIKNRSDFGGLNIPKPEPFDWFDLPEWIQEEFEKWQQKKPTVPDPTNSALTLRNLKAFLKALFSYCVWLVEGIVRIITVLVASMNRLTTTQQRYVLWLVLNQIYDLYYNVRLSLAYFGYIHPEPDMLPVHFSSIVTPTLEDYNRMLESYPYERVVNKEQTYHLHHPSLFPGCVREAPYTRPYGDFPFGELNVLEHIFNGPSGSQHQRAFTSLAGSTSMDDVSSVFFNKIPGWCNAEELFAEFLRAGTGNIPNLNLDGDRGYGWPCWVTGKSSWQDNNMDFQPRL